MCVIDQKILSIRHGFLDTVFKQKIKYEKTSTRDSMYSLFARGCILRKCVVEIVFRGYISDLVCGQQQANYPICWIEHQKFNYIALKLCDWVVKLCVKVGNCHSFWIFGVGTVETFFTTTWIGSA